MNRLRAARQRGVDDLVGAQITFLGRRRPDQHRFVAYRDMLGIGVRFRINGNGLDAHAARGGSHTACDFTAIGNQDFCEHFSLLFCYVATRIRCGVTRMQS